jgi:signal transduction histidine kinase
MRERAEELGGSFAVTQSATGGVTVEARLPIGVTAVRSAAAAGAALDD